MRGEQNRLIAGLKNDMGSPPLARGTVTLDAAKMHLRRITPACAGNSILFFAFRDKSWDHPRLRGEQNRLIAGLKNDMGSPPLARGTAALFCTTAKLLWITPACAGNSMRVWRTRANGWDHPRLRGEQSAQKEKYSAEQGSPPLARGTAMYRLPKSPAVRITPACAGNR